MADQENTSYSKLTHDEKVNLIHNSLKILKSDEPKTGLIRAFAERYLYVLDPKLATETAVLTKKAIKEIPEINQQQEMQLRVSMLINAFELLDKKFQAGLQK